jgi:hypothetical protein
MRRKERICAMFPAVAAACSSARPLDVTLPTAMMSTGTQCDEVPASSEARPVPGLHEHTDAGGKRDSAFFSSMQDRFEKERSLCQSLDAAYSLSLSAHLR